MLDHQAPHIEVTEKAKRLSLWNRFWNYDYNIIPNNSRFIFFILFLVLLYIYNGQVYEKKVREISQKMLDIKDVEYEYRHLNAIWTTKTKASELEKKLAEKGIRISSDAPFLIPKKN